MSMLKLICACAVVAAAPVNVFGGAALKEDFITAYEGPARLLATAYNGLRLQISCARHFDRDGVPESIVRKGALLIADNRLSIDERFGDASRVVVATPVSTYIVSRKDKISQPRLDGWDLDYGDYTQKIRLTWPIPFAAYCFCQMPLLEYLQQSDVEITSRKDSEDGALCEIQCRRRFRKNGKLVDQRSAFRLMPQMSWALAGYRFGGPEGDGTIVDIEYHERTEGGIPIPSHFTRFRKRDGIRNLTYESEALAVERRPNVNSAFDLASLGIGEVGADVPRRSIINTSAIIVGFVCLVAGALFRPRRTARHRRVISNDGGFSRVNADDWPTT